MRHSSRSNQLRITAGIMGLMVLAMVLFSAFYIAAEADHDCAGKDCTVCACIRQCENALHGIENGKAAPSGAVTWLILILFTAVFSVTAASQDTPVSSKVRLNN